MLGTCLCVEKGEEKIYKSSIQATKQNGMGRGSYELYWRNMKVFFNPQGLQVIQKNHKISRK